MNRYAFFLLFTFAISSFALGCSEDVNQTRCEAGEELHPITGNCIARVCAEDEVYNPVNGTCTPGTGIGTGDGVGNGDGTGDSSGSGDEETPVYDPDCPFNQDCSDDGSDGGVGPFNPGGNYDPFQPQDPSTAQYHSCDSDQFAALPQPQFVLSGQGDYLLAAAPSVKVSPATIPGANTRLHFMEHANDGYAAFILSMSPRTGQSNAQDVADWIASEAGAISGYSPTRTGPGVSYRTHDNYRASVFNHLSIQTGDAPGEVRDKLVARLYGVAPGDFQYNLTEQAQGDGSALEVSYKTVWRNEDRVIIVGAITTANRMNAPEGRARFAVQDLTGGTALAMAGETMTDECVSLELTDTQEVDIIISMDASGSMSDVQNSLIGFSDTLVNILNASGVDWRIGVTGVDCHNIRDDDALSWDFRELWPDPDEWEGSSIPFPFPGIDMSDFDTPCRNPSGIGGIGGGNNNGRLMQGTFTTSPQEIASRLGQVSSAGLEYTLTMGLAAIDHSLPRSDTDPSKIRTNAAVVVIAVTDENEQLFKDAFSWISGESQNISAARRAELEAFIEPWLGWTQRPDIGATVFGLYWVPGTSCPGGEDVAHGIHYFVEQTGGVGDSICNPDINQSFLDIANATLDITTGLRLVGNPLASSVRVDVTNVADQSVAPLSRSTEDGFDFDSSNYSLLFAGPSTPQTGQRITIPYLRWNRTIIPCATDNACPGLEKCVLGRCN